MIEPNNVKEAESEFKTRRPPSEVVPAHPFPVPDPGAGLLDIADGGRAARAGADPDAAPGAGGAAEVFPRLFDVIDARQSDRSRRGHLAVSKVMGEHELVLAHLHDIVVREKHPAGKARSVSRYDRHFRVRVRNDGVDRFIAYHRRQRIDEGVVLDVGCEVSGGNIGGAQHEPVPMGPDNVDHRDAGANARDQTRCRAGAGVRDEQTSVDEAYPLRRAVMVQERFPTATANGAS